MKVDLGSVGNSSSCSIESARLSVVFFDIFVDVQVIFLVGYFGEMVDDDSRGCFLHDLFEDTFFFLIVD